MKSCILDSFYTHLDPDIVLMTVPSSGILRAGDVMIGSPIGAKSESNMRETIDTFHPPLKTCITYLQQKV